MMKYYISGPVTGIPDWKERFRAAERKYRGYRTVSPRKIGLSVRLLCLARGRSPSWSDYMRACIRSLVRCDGIIMLQGWSDSRGALIERLVAEKLGLEVITDSIDGILEERSPGSVYGRLLAEDAGGSEICGGEENCSLSK